MGFLGSKVKCTYFLIGFTFFATISKESPVDSITAKIVGSNFYSQYYGIKAPSLSLVHAEKSSNGIVVWYIYNTIPAKGFVIVSAEDAAYPILGYSSEGYYSVSNISPEFTIWMAKYKRQIDFIRSNNYKASADIQNEWGAYKNNLLLNRLRMSSGSVSPLVKTIWAQSPYYNALCPGGSVAGCVATAMGQIMKYWNYPPHGIGSSSYMDSPFGTLYADFDSTQYDWSQMPLNVTRTNSSVATLMYDCGVGVQMAYSDTSSGSYIITGDDPVCAQSAFVQYFGYSGASIQGLYRQNYSDNDWTTLLEDELNNKRPFLYAGSGNQGSHAWVCDGYDATGYFHMNWGWAGYEDGYFSLDALNPDNIPLNSDEEALIGIGPSPAVADFNGNNLVIRAGDSVKFIDNSMGYVPLTSWNWSFNGTEAIYSTAQNPVVIYNEIGTFNVSETVTGSEGSNTLTRNSYITVLENNPVNVYPTLNDGTFTIQLHDPSLATSNLEFALYDMLGRKIYATALVQYSTQITLNVPHGMYFFRAFDISGKSVSTGKLAIK